MSTPRISVTKPRHIVPGAFYWIKGTTPQGIPIPPQLFRAESPPKQFGFLGRPWVWGTTFFNYGLGWRKIAGHLLFLDNVGVYAGGFSKVLWMTRNKKLSHIIENDLHMERVTETDQKAFERLLNDKSYTDKLKKPDIIVVSR